MDQPANSPVSVERAQLRLGFDKPLRRDWPSITPIRVSRHKMERAEVLFRQPLFGVANRPPDVAGDAALQAFAVEVYGSEGPLAFVTARITGFVCHCDRYVGGTERAR